MIAPFRFNSVSALLALAGIFLLPSCDTPSGKAAASADQTAESNKAEEDEFVLVQRLVNNDGAFQLLTLVEGPEANERFVKNLQLVQAQRAVLKKLEAEPEKTDEITKKIEEISTKLEENSQLMAKIYGYEATSDYAFFPIRSAIVREADGKKILVKKIDSPKRHQQLQSIRAEHAALIKRDGEASEAAKVLAEKMLDEFDFDVSANHQVEVFRGALYRKITE